MSDKALSSAELELTQRIQMHFPRDAISIRLLHEWNSCPKEVLTKWLERCFRTLPSSVVQTLNREHNYHFLGMERRSPVWKTIFLRAYKTPVGYRTALLKAGYYLSRPADEILAKVICAPERSMTDLAVLSTKDLGFQSDVQYRDVITQAKKIGLGLCTEEVGPALRLAYNDQPDDENLLVAMEPINSSNGDSNVFTVGELDGDLWLDCKVVNMGYCRPDDRLVFVRSMRKS